MDKRYLILGAGPAGLSVACSLYNRGIKNITVLEKEASAGGLCRSEDVDGSPLDIGGGHFLDVRRPQVNEFLYKYMPKDEWDFYDRNSQIVVNDNVIGSPIEANIWQMKIEDQVEYLKAIAIAGCNLGEPMPEAFIEWITWKLGDKIASDYMIPYNQKMFGDDLDQLGTYWLEKLPDVSFDETLMSCLTKKPYGKQPGHAQFYYPKKYGYGELWIRMAESLGEKIVYNCPVTKLDLNKLVVNDQFEADIIINTVPWTSFDEIVGIDEDIKNRISKLKHSSVVIEYFPENIDTDAQWIYYPDPELSYHRILVRHNFCPNSRGYWTETNYSRILEKKNGIKFKDSDKKSDYSYVNEYAYPLNTIDKRENISEILKYMKNRNIIGLGRWGEHEHYNSDLVVSLAMELADRLIKED